MDITTIQCIMEDVLLTNKEIRDEYNISHEVEFAIRECSEGLQLEAIRYRLGFLQPGLKSHEIREIMYGD